jgi:predicted nuclease of predicted toxin-antitoxin system
MRLLLDQDVYAVTARFLVDTGYDVVLVAQIGLSQASDEEILTGLTQLSQAMARLHRAARQTTTTR